MTLGWRCLIVLLIGTLTGLSGCGEANTPAKSTGDPAGETTGESTTAEVHKSYTVDELPAAGVKIPPADQGRVVITLPEGWKTLQRNPKYLVAFIPDESSASKLPRITVSVADAPAGVAESTTTENSATQAEALESLAAKEGKKFIETCKPLGLGDHVWIRHVRSAKQSSGDPVAIQALQTIRGGRMYTVELSVTAKDNPRSSSPPIIYQKSLEAHKKFAYSTAAHMEFPMDGAGPSPTPEPAKEAAPAEPAAPGE